MCLQGHSEQVIWQLFAGALVYMTVVEAFCDILLRSSLFTTHISSFVVVAVGVLWSLRHSVQLARSLSFFQNL